MSPKTTAPSRWSEGAGLLHLDFGLCVPLFSARWHPDHYEIKTDDGLVLRCNRPAMQKDNIPDQTAIDQASVKSWAGSPQTEEIHLDCQMPRTLDRNCVSIKLALYQFAT